MEHRSVYEYVVYFVPTREQREEGYDPEIIEVGQTLASNEEKARMFATRQLSSEWDDKLDQITVLVRPF